MHRIVQFFLGQETLNLVLPVAVFDHAHTLVGEENDLLFELGVAEAIVDREFISLELLGSHSNGLVRNWVLFKQFELAFLWEKAGI